MPARASWHSDVFPRLHYVGGMPGPSSAIVGWLIARLTRLRFPALFAFAATLFVIDLLVPDVIPFADEILLGLVTALLASVKRRGEIRPVEPGNAE